MKVTRFIGLMVVGAVLVVWGVLTWFIVTTPEFRTLVSFRLAQMPKVEDSMDLPESTSSSTSTSSPKVAVAQTPPAKKYSVVFVSPAANDMWIFGKTNVVEWSGGTDTAGQAYLLDTVTGKIAGWIQQQIAPRQKTFAWDTRYMFLSRTSPLKKDVPFGRYRIVLGFDLINLWVKSPIFSIVPGQEDTIPTSTAN